MQVDPLAEAYSYQSPYVYADNNPIKFIDFMGLGSVYNWDTERYEDEGGNEVSWADVQTEYFATEESNSSTSSDPDPNDPLKANYNRAKKVEDWAIDFDGISLHDLKYDDTELLNSENGKLKSKSGGNKSRFVIDPKTGNVIDMKHFLKIGNWEANMGKGVGKLVEILQGWQGFTGSAHHPQDYFSNELGRQFFLKHQKKRTSNKDGYESIYYEFPTGVANAIVQFLNNRE